MDQRLIYLIVVFTFFENKVLAGSAVKIVNGTTAEEGEFPYMIQLRTEDDSFRCGGSIIGSEWILTAAHCVGDKLSSSIVYGTNKAYNYSKDLSIQVKKWYRHPNYAFNGLIIPFYDIGVLQLEKAIPFSDTVQPIQLPVANSTIPFHVQGVLSGWGYNVTGGHVMPELQKINRQLLTDDECYQKLKEYNMYNFNATHNVCSDDHYDGECSGDSGSPLVINGIQYGIVSWNFKPCGESPGAYSRIANPEYRNWVEEVSGI